jgi:hypothetical protein
LNGQIRYWLAGAETETVEAAVSPAGVNLAGDAPATTAGCKVYKRLLQGKPNENEKF